MTLKIENDEWMDLLLSLENHHAIFYKLWQMGKPAFSNDIETAACQFDKTGNFIVFLFNPNFWNSLDQYNKLFVISHECLHLVLNHGVRIKDSFSNRQACNKCLDIVVNHLLVESFNFDRKKIIGNESYCWIDTVFPDENVLKNQTFEYYYSLFEKSYGDGAPSLDTNTVDDHDKMDFDSSNVLDEALSQVSDFDKNALSVLSKHVGAEKSTQWATISICSKVKQKWESVIKEWSMLSKKCATKDTEQWSRLNRRLFSMQSDLMLPSDMEIEDLFLEKSRIKVAFFLDSSGSCWHLRERFFQAALSLDPRTFSVDLFCFDVSVHKVDPENLRVLGGGGTSFATIESYIQNSGENYPDGVFVITDGYGDRVYPEFPHRWHWFLVEDSSTRFLPKQSGIYYLSDFE